MPTGPMSLSSHLLRGSLQSLGRCIAQRSCRRLWQAPTLRACSRGVAAAAAQVEAPAAATSSSSAAAAADPAAAAAEDAAPVYKAYIDFKFVRDNVELLAANCAARGAAADPRKASEPWGASCGLQGLRRLPVPRGFDSFPSHGGA